MALTAAIRRRGLLALLCINFLMFCGFFMVVPLVSVHYVDTLGFAAVVVGLGLAMRQMVQQGFSLVGGMLADRCGVRGLIALGVLIRAVGFVSLAWASSAPLLFLALFLSAVGGALFEAPSRAAIAALTTPEDRARFYSLTGVITGVGMTIGPLLGAFLLHFDFRLVCLAAASCFVLVFVVTMLVLPPVQVASEPHNLGYGLRLALRDRPFMLLTVLLMGYWFMWVQLTISLPLEARFLTGTSDSVGVIYAINAGMMVLLQYPLLRLAERWLRPMPILTLGMLLMSLGLGAVALVQNFAAFIACLLIFAVGVLLATPTQQSVTADLADPRALGSYFGVSAMALAFGGGIGNLIGGWLVDLAQQLNWMALPWLVFCTVGLCSTVGLFMLTIALQRQAAPREAPLGGMSD